MNSRSVVLLSLLAVPGALGWIACGSVAPGDVRPRDAGAGSGGDDASGSDSGGDSDGSASDSWAADAGVEIDGSPCGNEGGSGSSSGGGTGMPACASDGGIWPDGAVPAFGSFTGLGLSGDVCAGGAFAYLEQAVNFSPPFTLMISTAEGIDPSSFFEFRAPANATGGDVEVFVGVSTATPGTYPSCESCGRVGFCVYLPVPPGVDCGDAAVSDPASCPAGCGASGPVSGPWTCTPIVPGSCYAAQAPSDCVNGTQTREGSWSLTLTSVVRYNGTAYYVVHGALTATMIGDDAGLGSTNIELSF